MRALLRGAWVPAETANDAQDVRAPAPSDLKPDEIPSHAPENRRSQHQAQVELSVGGQGAGNNKKKKRRHRKAQLAGKHRQKNPWICEVGDRRHGLVCRVIGTQSIYDPLF